MHIRDLYIYPVKSAAGIRVEVAMLDACGLVDDRRWMVVDAAGRFLSQRELPRLALIQARPDPVALALAAPGMADLLCVRPPASAPTERFGIWDDTCAAVDCGAAAAAWLSTFLAVACRLVYRPDAASRLVDQHYATPTDRVGLADGFPLLLIGHASLDAVNERLVARGDAPVPMNRFRPNVVVTTVTAHQEDEWRTVAVGALPLLLDVVKPCARCSILPVDQATGIRGIEPLRTLATYRRRDGKVFFGQNVIHRTTGILRVGDTVGPRVPDGRTL